MVEADDARVGDGNSKDVTGQVSQYGIFALAPGCDPDDPRFGPGGRGNDQVGAPLRKPRLELALNELGDGGLGSKEGGAGWMPARGSAGRDAATGDEAMDVGVVMEPLAPGMQNGKDTDGTADEARIAGNIDDDLGSGLHQQGIAIRLVGAQNLTQLFGYGG